MIRIFVTGDNHIGRNYERHPAKVQIAQARMDALRTMVDFANRKECDLFAITGDLFDRISGIAKSVIHTAADILAEFNGVVLVLPGNHDYYNEEVKLWKDMEACAAGGNVLLLTGHQEYELSKIRGQQVVLYPACCQSKHAKTNQLGWIKEIRALIPQDHVWRIGMAHGALEGLSLDREGQYFGMSMQELLDLPMDLWLVGHTHMPYPANLDTEEFTEGQRIFNPGTHVQTDVHCNAPGCGFLIELDYGEDGKKLVRARRFDSGNLRFYRKSIQVKGAPQDTHALEQALLKAVSQYDDHSVVELIINGSITQEEYRARSEIYGRVLGRFLECQRPDDHGLSELITEQMVQDAFAQTSLPARMLMKLLGEDEIKEAQMLFDLLAECREE